MRRRRAQSGGRVAAPRHQPDLCDGGLAAWQPRHRRRWPGSSGRSSRAARPPGSPTANCSSGSPPRRRPTRPPSPPSWHATGRWCWASAASSWAIAIMPRTPSRPSSSCWPARPARSATPTCWATGSMAWRCAPHARPAAGSHAAARTEEDRSVRPSRGDIAAAGRAGDRPRAGRGAASRDRPLAGHLPPAGRALLLRGPLARRGSRAAALARPAPSAAGWSGRGEAPPRTGSPRRRPPDDRAGRGCCRPDRRRRPSHPLLCDTTTRAAIAFAARHAAARALLGPPRHWPGRSSDPC